MRYHGGRHRARTTDDYVFHQLIPYLGSKRRLLDLIGTALAATGVDPCRGTFADLFAGSGVVSRYARQLGFHVVANDWEPYARVLNTAAIACDGPPPCRALGGYAAAIAHLDRLPGCDGWITRHLCPTDDDRADPTRERMFYQRRNGRRIDAIREQIAIWQRSGAIDDAEASALLSPLLYQACWLANTSGVFKAYHHGWGGSNGTALHRIAAELRLQPARFLANGRPGQVTTLDARAAAASLGPIDIAYLDPPYNQHPYASNYHVLNSIAVWDQPELPPVQPGRGTKSAIRADWRQRRSPYNHRTTAGTALAGLLHSLQARFMLTSYSTDGTIALPELLAMHAERGALSVFCRRYKRYRTSPTRPSPRPTNVEFVLLVDTSLSASEAQVQAVRAQIAAE